MRSGARSVRTFLYWGLVEKFIAFCPDSGLRNHVEDHLRIAAYPGVSIATVRDHRANWIEVRTPRTAEVLSQARQSLPALVVEDLQLQRDCIALVELGAVLRQHPGELRRPFQVLCVDVIV